MKEEILGFQKRITDLDELNLEDTIKYVYSCGLYQKEEFIAVFTSELYIVLPIRPKNLHIYAKLINEVIILDVSRDLTRILIDSFIDLLYLRSDENDTNGKIMIFRLYYLCSKENPRIIDLIVRKLHELMNENTKKINFLALSLVFFGGTIKNIDNTLFVQLFEYVKSQVGNISMNKTIKEMLTGFSSIDDINWDLLNDLSEFGHRKHSTQWAIFYDQIDKLQEIASTPGFNPNHVFDDMVFEKSTMIQAQPNLVQYAALFGSIDCFKYLFLNHCELHSKDRWSQSLASFAVAGGNMDIIHILLQKNISFDDTLEAAIEFRQYEVFHWLFDELSSRMDKKYLLEESLSFSCIYNNLYVTDFIFSNGLSPNCTLQSIEWSPLHFGLVHSHISVVIYLLSIPEFNTNIRDKAGETPLVFACKRGNPDIVKYLVNDHRVDVNESDQYGWTPLHYSCNHNQEKIVSILLSSLAINVNIYSSRQELPIDIAISKGYRNIKNMILVKMGKKTDEDSNEKNGCTIQ